MASKIVVNLDTSKEVFLNSKCKQNDDLILECNIFENGLTKDLTNCSIVIQALKADKTYIIQNTDITKNKNNFIANLVRDFTRVSGETEIEIVLTESSKQNTTFSFCLEVVGSVIRGAVESKNTVTILEILQDKIEEAGVVKQETEQLIEKGGAATKGDIQEVNAHLETKANIYSSVEWSNVKENNIGIISLETNNNNYIPNGEYTINRELNIEHDLKITGDNAILKSTDGFNIKIKEGCKNVYIENIVFDNVALTFDSAITSNIDLYINNCIFKNTKIYGVYCEKINKLIVENSSFLNIGTNVTDINYQGVGIRINKANYVKIDKNIFENNKGTAAALLRKVCDFEITNNTFNKNDYRAIALSNDSDYTFECTGIITGNAIKECGTFATHSTGVGCNGIYGNKGDFSKVKITNNTILNCCENSIEGTFGEVSNNIIDGTGVDMVNHPTPSASGVNLYGGVYKNNIIRNTYLSAMYVYDNVFSDGLGIQNLTIDGNIIENSGGNESIYLNATKYKNVKVINNTTDKPLYVRNNSDFENFICYKNICLYDNFYKNAYNSNIVVKDNGSIVDTGFTFPTDTTLTGYTLSNVTIEKNSDISSNDGLTMYYPKLINSASNNYGRLEKTFNVPKNSLLQISITYKGNSINLSYYRKRGNVNGTPILYKTLPTTADFKTVNIIYNTDSSDSVLLYIKANNGAIGESVFIKDITYKIISI